jgi:hypothetical protein
LLVPQKYRARLPSDMVWVTLMTAMVAVMVYEKRWFF